MELPPFHTHHRYVPPPPPPPPSENPNFYQPYSHCLPPPPPPPQQQLPPPPLPPLPPPPYHLSRPHLPPPPPPPPQSQFSFRPHIEERRVPVPVPAPTPAAGQVSNFIPPYLLNQPRSLSPPRVPSQYHNNGHPNPTFYGDNSPVLDPWPEFPPLPRAPIEPDFRYQHQRRPLSPLPSRIDNYINEFEHSVRFRDEFIKEGFRDDGNPELLLWGRQKERDFGVRDEVDDDKYRYCNGYDEFGSNLNSGFERNIDRINRDFVSADSQCNDIGLISSRDFALNVGNYESYNDMGNYESYNDRGEDLTWGYSRLENRNEYMDGEGIPLPAHGMRHELLDGGCNGVDRLSMDRRGEGVEEFLSRSPKKKQVQKKSALLRIQFGKGNNRNNNRNRSHDNSRYSRSHYEESSLSVGGSFKGKEKNFSDWKMEEQREKSPVELDVSFKSNALIAKAIKNTSSLVIESDGNLAPGNRKLKKTNVANSPGNKFCDDYVKFGGSTHVLDSSSVADNEHRESKKKIISFKTASSVGGLVRPSSSNTCSKEAAENTVMTRGDSRASEFDFSSGSDKEPGLLAEKMSVCNSKTDAVDGNITGEESVNLIGSHQDVKRVAPGEVLNQITKKRKTVESGLLNGAALQSMSALCESTSPGDSSTDSLSAGSQLDESITHSKDGISSASISEMYGSLSLSLANTFEKLNNASENVVSDLKEGCVSISSSLQLPSECSALKSVSLIPGDADAVHANRLVRNGLSWLNTDTGLAESQYASVTSGIRDLDDSNEHPCLEGSLLVENDHTMKATVSAESNAGLEFSRLKENKFHDSQIHTSSSKHDQRTASTSDKGSCRKPGDIIVADTGNVNTDSKEFLLDQDNVSHENNIAKDSPNPDISVSLIGICHSSKIEETSIQGSIETQDLSGNISSSTKFFTDSLGNKTVSDICSLKDSFKQAAVGGATTLLVNPPGERSPKSMDSHSSGIGKKRKAKDDQLGVHGKKTSKIAGSMVSALDDDGRCSSLLAKELVSVEEEVDFRNGVKTIGRDCLEGELPEFNPSLQGGKERKDFPFTSTSSVLSEIGQGPKDSIISNPSADCLSNSEEGTTTQPEDRVALSSPHNDGFTCLTAYSDASGPQLQGNNITGESYQSLGGGTKGQCSRIDHGMSCPPKWEADNKDNTALAISDSDIQLSEDAISGDGKNNFARPDKNQKQQFGNGDCENYLLLKENLAVPSNDVPSCADVCGISASSSTDRQINSVPDTLSNVGSPEAVISNLRSDVLDNESRLGQISYKYNENDDVSNKNPISGGDMRALPLVPSSQISDTGTESGYAISLDLAVKTKAASLLPQNTSRVIPDSYPKLKSPLTNNRQNFSVAGNFPGHTSIKYPYKAKVSAVNYVAKPRTWHRTLKSSPSVVGPKPPGNCIHPQSSSGKEVVKSQSSYVRRGNSLVRKPSPVGAAPQVLLTSGSSVHHLNSGINNVRKGSEQKIDIADSPSSATFGTSNSCPGRPKTQPLMDNVKLLNCTAPIPQDLIFPLLPDSPRNDVETNGPPKSAEDLDNLRSSEADLKSFGVNGCQTDSTKDLECQSNADERNSGKQILYVKRKSNQLVAASNRDDPSLHTAESAQMLSSDGYYKRKKNQLIWTSLKEGDKQSGVVSDNVLNSRQKDAQNNIHSTSSSKRQSGKGFMKKKYSLVWTLHNTLSSRKYVSAGRWRRLLPYLFPWKRAMNGTNFMHRLSAIPNGPVSTIGQKLLLSRKRDAVYKRSISGFSLRRSKVFSVGGCNLKWSKSIERNSRKANEDATLAVVAAEKRKRVAKDGAAVTLSRNQNYVSRRSGYSIKLCPGERIFRIGLERYRMDPTRKTLQRISDEQPSNSDDQLAKNRKKFYVPRRLVIGSDEYIRIGNGNQLVRDPKRRTRILANEKVRWSLHTARLRLARKKKYCQFFTRFGKCNKDDKRCPYIHDPSKIAVCTKFLNGACPNPDCKLTHQVIPERMQVCSYFLQGLCSNESCPYRHVNVNPNSPICEGFLRGYCADGNECRKKHTYVCPVFEATGNCPQGPKCKLHHPKMKKKGMKRKTLNLQKNARGRYFGTRPVDFTDCRAVVSRVICGKGDESSFDEDSKFADFISLDVDIEEMEHAFEQRSESICDGEGPSDMQLAVPDELIKPVRLMNKNLIIASSPAVESSSEMTTSYVSEESLCR